MQRNVSTCVMSGLEMFYFLGSWIALMCLWCWGCDEGLLSSFQGSSILTTFFSPEEKYPPRGGDTAQTHGEGAAEPVFAACPIHGIIVPIIIPQRMQGHRAVFQTSGVQEVLGKDGLRAWKWKSSFTSNVRLLNWWDSGCSVHIHEVICAH